MSLFTFIEEILQDRCIVYKHTTRFILRESTPGNACSEVRVEVTGPCIVCRFETLKAYVGASNVESWPYFKSLVNVKKMCDYIVFYKHKTNDNKVCVFLCELKGAAGYRLQMKAGYSFARFIIDAARRYAEHNQINCTENIEYRGVAFTNNPSFKHNIDPKRKEYIKVDNSSSSNFEYFEVECKGVINSFPLHLYTY